jgi:hypothetical protein
MCAAGFNQFKAVKEYAWSKVRPRCKPSLCFASRGRDARKKKSDHPIGHVATTTNTLSAGEQDGR